jgi:hypothetical protein
MANEVHIEDSDHWFVGEDKILEFTVYQSDGITPQNITGWTLEWVLRKAASAIAATLSKTTAAGITITNALAGICQVAITDDDTVALAPGTYFHTLRRTDSGSETVLAFGTCVLKHAATR